MQDRFEAEGVTLILGDCRDFLPMKADLLLTDPPYGIDADNQKRILSRSNSAEAKDYGESQWDKTTISEEVMNSLRAQCNWQIIFGGNYYHLPPSSCWLVWDKENGANDFADCELAWTNLQKAVRLKRHLWNGMIRKGREERFHPTQKPLDVMVWALQQAPKEVVSVFDPFMGAGTSGVASQRLGKVFLGIERDPKHFQTAVDRIQRELDSPVFDFVKPKVECVTPMLF